MLSLIRPNDERKRPKQVADIMAQIMVTATIKRFIPVKSTLKTMAPTIRPQTDAQIAKNAGNTPVASISGSLAQGDAIIDLSLPKYRSDTNIFPSPKMQAFVQSKNAFPITQFVRLLVLKL